MEIRADFLEWLGPDASTNVLMLLDDPADIVRLSTVSQSWRRYVISNGFCKKLCLRRCGAVSCFTHVIVETNANKSTEEAGSSSDSEWVNLVKEHKVYSYLGRCLFKPLEDDELIGEAVHASSTDNDQYIETTLLQGDRVDMRPLFWSSKVESDPGVPETLIYRLGARFCLVNEIKVQPFEAYYQPGNPIYSAKSVRFRMGHSLLDPDEDLRYITWSSQKLGINTLLYDSDGEFVWTYVSPEFPMAQRNELQTFKLPSPVLCIGGFVQVELMGRIQVQAADNLYYMCVCNVQVIGRPISHAFNVDIDDDSGGSVLKYIPDKQSVYESWSDTIYYSLQHRMSFIQEDVINNQYYQDQEMMLMAAGHFISDGEEDVAFIVVDIEGMYRPGFRARPARRSKRANPPSRGNTREGGELVAYLV